MNTKNLDIRTCEQLNLPVVGRSMPSNDDILLILEQFLQNRMESEYSGNIEMWIEIYKKAFVDGFESKD
tara:strand:- start:840 stop:1046 length:207 start_codon:yes stop_codon:yes gene_type:complete